MPVTCEIEGAGKLSGKLFSQNLAPLVAESPKHKFYLSEQKGYKSRNAGLLTLLTSLRVFEIFFRPLEIFY